MFHGHDQTLFNKDYELIDWEPPYWAVDCGVPGTMFRGRLPRRHKLRGRVLVLSAPGGTNNIWHLLFDELPKLELARQAGVDWESCDYFLINSRKASFEREALRILGLPDEKIVETDDVSFVQADELFFVTLGCLIPPDPWVLEWVRSKFIQGPAPSGAKSKIFLSRKDAIRRRFRNEDQLWHKLHDQGFVKAELGRMSLTEQIGCFRGASTIVAPHGAGLTNLVWAEPGTKVIELFSKEYVNACYWLIADMLKLDYAFGIGEATMEQCYTNRAIMDMDRLGADIVFKDINSLADRIDAFIKK
jgi:capsular polysaccharide biosynthesis protein